MKAGDGTSTFNTLGFLSGHAADVYDWAKAKTKPSYTANEISGLTEFISGEIEDTDTQYKIEQDASNAHILHFYSKPKAATEWTKITSVTLPDTVYDDTAVRGLITANKTAIDDLESDVAQKANAADVYTKTEIEGLVAGVYHFRGSVETYADLPTEGQATGDVYNIVAADTAHGIKAGDNVAWDGTAWDVLAGTVDLSGYATKSELNGKVDKVTGARLMTDEEAAKLTGIEAGAQANKIQVIKINGTTLTVDANKAVDIPVPTGALASKSKVAEADLETALATKINGKADNSSLAAIAKSGNVKDLMQTSGDVLV